VQNLIFTLNLVAPVFLIVLLGYTLKRLNIINDNFVTVSSRVVFSITLPALIFTEIVNINLKEVFNADLILFVYAGTIASFILIWIFAIPIIKNGRDKASFIQGSFRGNFAIVGLAIIVNIYGVEMLGKASLVLAFTIPLYNVLAVIALIVPLKGKGTQNYKATLLEIIRNPLIIAVIISLPFSYFNIEIPFVISGTITYLAALALPLALLGIGGFLSFKGFSEGYLITISSTMIKMIVIPLAATYAAYLLGFQGDDLGIIFILFACPTAIASFIMAEAMGANSRLAGNILLLTTLVSVVTMTLGLFILREYGLI
jgi:malonate transporter